MTMSSSDSSMATACTRDREWRKRSAGRAQSASAISTARGAEALDLARRSASSSLPAARPCRRRPCARRSRPRSRRRAPPPAPPARARRRSPGTVTSSASTQSARQLAVALDHDGVVVALHVDHARELEPGEVAARRRSRQRPGEHVARRPGQRQADVVGVELGRVLGLHPVLFAELLDAVVGRHRAGDLQHHARAGARACGPSRAPRARRRCRGWCRPRRRPPPPAPRRGSGSPTLPPGAGEQVEVLRVDLAVGAVLAAVLRALAGEHAAVEAKAEVDRRVGGEPVDEARREELAQPGVVLALGDLDDVAAVELDRLEAADVLARAPVAGPVEERRLEPLGAHREHRQVADRLGDPADHDRVLHRHVHPERLAVDGLVAKPPGDAAGELARHRPAGVADRPVLLARQRHPRPDQLRADGEPALGRVGAAASPRCARAPRSRPTRPPPDPIRARGA